MSTAAAESVDIGAALVITADGLDAVIAALKTTGHTVVGPRVEHGTIVHAEIASAGDLPRGRRDVQGPGAYRLEDRADGALFGFAAGAHSWKSFLYPAALTLWTARRDADGIALDGAAADPPRLALFGVRACDVAAIAILDRVLLNRAFADEDYRRRRERLFVVGVNCSDPAATCFCASMGTGPRLSSGYDLALTEIAAPEEPRFLVEIGTRRGAEVMASVPARAARQADRDAAQEIAARAAAGMGRTLETSGLPEWLAANPDHPNWQAAGARCLTCGNCTMVCPTCFCTTVRDVSDLKGTRAERQRLWDSCFTSEFSHIHGGTIRTSASSRLRHRVMHKLCTWHSQFGMAGCVGCGRCTTWCPAAIDMAAEVCMMRDAVVAAAPEIDNADA